MSFEVFLANLSPDFTEDQLRALCTPFGEVVKMDFTAEDWVLALTCVALVELVLAPGQKPGQVIKALNQIEAAPGWPIIASPVSPLKFRYSSQDLASQIAQTLSETDKLAFKQIGHVVALCGPDFAAHLLEKTLAVEAAGGLLTLDGTRRRTPGGVFLYLVKAHLSPQMRAEIFPTQRDRRLKARQQRPRVQVVEETHEDPGAVAEPPLMPPPAPSEEALAAQFRLAELGQALAEAREYVEQLKAGAAGAQGGFFTAAKRVVDLQQQIETLLQAYPALRDPR